MPSSPGNPRIGNSNMGVGMTLVLGRAEKSARRRRPKAVPRKRKGTEYPAATAAPLMPGLGDAAGVISREKGRSYGNEVMT